MTDAGHMRGIAIRRAITLKLRPRARIDRERSRESQPGGALRSIPAEEEPCGFPQDAVVGRDRPPALFWQARAAAKQSRVATKLARALSPSRGWIYVAPSIRQIFQRVSPSRNKPGSSMNNSSGGESFRACMRRGLA